MNIFKQIEKEINNLNIDDYYKRTFINKLNDLKGKKINILITGATGSGKSSTINAMFQTEISKVGIDVDPETSSIEKYELDNLIIWDTPGLGDGKEKDNQYAKAIIEKLNELDENGDLVIDLVLVVLDGSSRDLGTSYELINQVIIPNLGNNTDNRILIAINKADMAMSGRNWDEEKNQPKQRLIDFLDKKVNSVKNRIKEATGVEIEPIYYSAGYKDEDEEQKPWNLSKLLYFIVKNTPTKKRLVYLNNIKQDSSMWKDNDNLHNYSKKLQDSFFETLVNLTKQGVKIGGQIGNYIAGSMGETIGKVVGGAVGAVAGFFKSLFG
jgi:predicted GTPase